MPEEVNRRSALNSSSCTSPGSPSGPLPPVPSSNGSPPKNIAVFIDVVEGQVVVEMTRGQGSDVRDIIGSIIFEQQKIHFAALGDVSVFV